MEEQLLQLQKTQLEILKVFDSICRKNHLRYSLYAGTLLGAVRHKDFIPWDDDLDVCMLREDYDRFLKLWPDAGAEGYILQNKENSPDFSQSFSKIRKDHTTFLQEADVGKQYHKGIFIDVFPIDRIPNGRISRLKFTWDCLRYQLLMREFVPPKANPAVRLVSSAVLALTPKKKRAVARKKIEKQLERINCNGTLSVVFVETFGTMRTVYPAELANHYIELPFGKESFLCFANWETYLRIKYGDYMQLPPKEERVWRHHPLVIDFTHNYEELEDQV